MKQTVLKHPALFEGITWFYDGQAILYTTTLLALESRVGIQLRNLSLSFILLALSELQKKILSDSNMQLVK